VDALASVANLADPRLQALIPLSLSARFATVRRFARIERVRPAPSGDVLGLTLESKEHADQRALRDDLGLARFRPELARPPCNADFVALRVEPFEDFVAVLCCLSL